MLAYQVCECTTSAPAQSPTMARSTPSVRIAALAEASSAQVGVRRRARLVARPAEGVHARVDVVACTQRADQLGDVHPGAAVDLRRVLLAQHVDPHAHETSLAMSRRVTTRFEA